jgi:hypothetical protein
MISSNYSTPTILFNFLVWLMFIVHQQSSASADIQDAGGPSHHQQHSATGVLQHSSTENQRPKETNRHSDAMQLYRHRTTTFHRTSASTEIASITHGKKMPYP